MNKLISITFAALTMLTAACGPQAFVEVDTAAEGSFTVADPAPAVRALQAGVFVVLAEEQGDELALVTVEVTDLAALEVGQTVQIAEAGIAIEASRGDLEVIERSDGARIVNSQNTRSFPATGGVFTLDSVEPLAGTFAVELKDGGMLSGTFVAR
jgi:hypothetical protein